MRKAYFYFSIAVLYFGEEKFSTALKWINRLPNDSTINESQNIHCFVKIFNIIIHMELKNEDLLPYLLKSLPRYMNSRNRVYRFESVLLEFANQLTGSSQKKGKKIYKKCFDELILLSKDNFEKPCSNILTLFPGRNASSKEHHSRAS